ncbi:MAG: NRDE family protein [Planctomycetaceae bacterium]|jgi:uncharacterized protein with NRDE domain|nr:NRDE family protein [Planctomycetaceae bacterium]
MGILVIQYQSAEESPLLLALNREERIDRPALSPRIQAGKPRVVCGIDSVSSGTWAGINQYGLFVAVVNTLKKNIPAKPRSRGLLCRDLLLTGNAEEAADIAVEELKKGTYAGCHFLCVDRSSGFAVHGGDEVDVVKLTPGLHTLSENRLNDPADVRQAFIHRQLTLQKIDSAISFFAVASRTFSRRANPAGKQGVIFSKGNAATVSSMMVSLTEKSQRSIMQYANGSPDMKTYDDMSALLRQVLSTERAAKAAAAAKEAKQKDNEDEIAIEND